MLPILSADQALLEGILMVGPKENVQRLLATKPEILQRRRFPRQVAARKYPILKKAVYTRRVLYGKDTCFLGMKRRDARRIKWAARKEGRALEGI